MADPFEAMIQIIVNARFSTIYGNVNVLVLGLRPRTLTFTAINPRKLCINYYILPTVLCDGHVLINVLSCS